MKFRVLPQFSSDFSRLSREEKQAFTRALRVFIASCREYERSPDHYVWPRSLLVERLAGTRVMAMTWSYSEPDGRATFTIDTVDGELMVTWRRVGRHSIYREP